LLVVDFKGIHEARRRMSILGAFFVRGFLSFLVCWVLFFWLGRLVGALFFWVQIGFINFL
jgi:hypothetical protein